MSQFEFVGFVLWDVNALSAVSDFFSSSMFKYSLLVLITTCQYMSVYCLAISYYMYC